MKRRSVEIGQTYDFELKAPKLRGWTVVRVTDRCIVLDKMRGSRNPKYQHTGEVYLPWAQVAHIQKVKL